MRVVLSLLLIAITESASNELGRWSIIGQSDIVCIHTALLPDMRLVCVERPHEFPYPENPNNGGQLAVEIDFKHKPPKLTKQSISDNPFCAGHMQMQNGDIFYAGGDNRSLTNSEGAEFISNGRRGRRVFQSCSGNDCSVGTWTRFKDMSSERWYPTVATLADGTGIIIGGSTSNLDFDGPLDNNNPTYEYWPEKEGKWPRTLEILEKNWPHNLYPPVFQLPKGDVFLFVSNETVLINPKTDALDKSIGLIELKDKQPWIYPHTPTAVMLPFTKANKYATEIMVCGGSRYTNAAADDRCISLNFGESKPQWRETEPMPNARMMPDSIILPDTTILFVNGAGEGQAGGNGGEADYAHDPVFVSNLYDPRKPKNERWSKLAKMKIARLYHAGAILMQDGTVAAVGSEMQNYVDVRPTKRLECWPFERENPAKCTSPFEYRIEVFEPPYLFLPVERPVITKAPTTATYGSTIEIQVKTEASLINFVSFVRYSTVTHSTNTDQRLIQLEVLATKNNSLYVTLPNNGALAPPGNWMIFVLREGKPSVSVTLLLTAGEATSVEIPDDASKTGASNKNIVGLASFVASIMTLFFI